MEKNLAGQYISAELLDTEGAPVGTGVCEVYITIDGGGIALGTGACTHVGNGCWRYAPSQAETNGNCLAFIFAHAGARYVTINVHTRYLVKVGSYLAGQSPADSVLVTPANKLATKLDGSVTVGAYVTGQGPSELVLVNWQNKIATDVNNKVSVGNVTVGDYASGMAPGIQVLASPTYKLTTTPAGDVRVGAYASGFSPATMILVTPGNKLATDPAGKVTLASAQTFATTGTVGGVTGDVVGRILGGGSSSIVGIGAWARSSSGDNSPALTDVETILARLGAFTGTGANTVLGFFRAIARLDATLPSDMGGTYDPAADSLEVASTSSSLTAQAIRAEMDSGSTKLAAIYADTRSIVSYAAGIGEEAAAIKARLPATLSTGRMRSAVESIDSGAITSAAFASGAITSGVFGSGAITAAAIAAGAITAGTFAAGAITASAFASGAITFGSGAITSASFAAGAINAAAIAAGAITTSTLAASATAAIAAALLDATNGVETGVTVRQALQRIGAVMAGECSGAGTGTEVFVGLDGSTTRVTVSVTTAGNRTEVVYA